MKLKTIYIIVLSIVVQLVNAQENPIKTLTIDQARELMKANYPQLKSAELDIEAQNKIYTPLIEWGETGLHTGKEEVGNGSKGIQTLWGIEHEGINFFGAASKKKWKEAQINLAKSIKNNTLQNLEKEISQAWIKAYTQEHIFKVYEKTDSIFNGVIYAAKLNYEQGETAKLDYLALQNQSYLIKIKKEQALRDYQSALYKLNAYLNSKELYIPDSIPYEQLLSSFDLPKNMPSKNTLLQVEENKIKVADASYKKVKNEFLPKLNLTFERQKVDGENGFYSYQVGVKFPLFFNGLKTMKEKAKIEYEIAEMNYQQTALDLQTNYLIYQEDLLKWKTSWDYYANSALPLAKEQQKGSLLAYKEGEIDYITFVENMKASLLIEIDAWEVLAAYLSTYYELKFFDSL